jgi:hypothetical protein
LVVIVVFLVGILAVVQIFPKGFQLLITSRNNTQAEALGRNEVELLKASPDQIPDQILAVRYVPGTSTPVEDPTRNIFNLGLQSDGTDADTVTSAGQLMEGSTAVGDWLLHSGPNCFRRIIGEGQRVPAPRPVGSQFGGLRVLAYGPLDPKGPLTAYANDMVKTAVLPRNLVQDTVYTTQPNVSIGGNTVNVGFYNTSDGLNTNEYFVDQTGSQNAVIYLPNLPALAGYTPTTQPPRIYHLSLSAYVGTTSGYVRQDYPDLSVSVPRDQVDSTGYAPPLIAVPIGSILTNTPGALTGGQTLASIEYNPLRIQPEYYSIPTTSTFGADPFQYMLLDSNLGVLLFNPLAYQSFIETSGGAREPLTAKVDYDTLDWRILRQDFRVDSQLVLNGGDYAQFELSLPSTLVGTSTGPDGRPNGGLPLLETSTTVNGTVYGPLYAGTQNGFADNLLLVDIDTGGVISELDPGNANNQLVTVNKSQGIVSIHGAAGSSTTALNGYELLPGATTPVSINLMGRSLRVLYRARNNWAVFPSKAADHYSIVETNQTISSASPPAEGQVYVPVDTNGNPIGTKIYFPISDLHQKVTVDQIFYANGNGPTELDSQDFAVEYPTINGNGLPCIDVQSADTGATQLLATTGAVARNIKGASLTVQVVWNPDSFSLGSNATTNVSLINTWINGWRRSSTQTFLQTENIQ